VSASTVITISLSSLVILFTDFAILTLAIDHTFTGHIFVFIIVLDMSSGVIFWSNLSSFTTISLSIDSIFILHALVPFIAVYNSHCISVGLSHSCDNLSASNIYSNCHGDSLLLLFIFFVPVSVFRYFSKSHATVFNFHRSSTSLATSFIPIAFALGGHQA
jgi:hypothetical protein